MYNDFYALETIGEVFFRRSGLHGDKVLCVIVRTRANYNPSTKNIQFIELLSGHTTYQSPEWFADWTPDDNWNSSNHQSGRPVDIAVPIDDYEALTGRRPLALRTYDRGTNKFGSPIVAIRIENRWHEVHDLNPLRRVDMISIDDFISRNQ